MIKIAKVHHIANVNILFLSFFFLFQLTLRRALKENADSEIKIIKSDKIAKNGIRKINSA